MTSLTPEQIVEEGLTAQRSAADPTASIWVGANAGAGKTRVLVDRIRRLLLSGVASERILCLTFTKAAAAEMAERLHRELGRWITLGDDALKEAVVKLTGKPADSSHIVAARRLFAEILDAPGGIRVQTIHSFCQSLLARFPLEAGVAPHFSVMDERTAGELLSEAQALVILSLEKEKPGHPLAAAFRHIASLADEGGSWAVLGELMKDRAHLARLLQAHQGAGGLAQALRAALSLKPNDTEESLCRAFCAAGAFDEAGLRAAAAALGEGSNADQTRAEIITRFLDADVPARREILQGDYRGLFLTNEDEARKNIITKKVQAADPNAENILRDEQERVRQLVDSCKAARVADNSHALIHLGAAVLEAYEAEKHKRALLDYDDLILKTRDLLRRDKGASWVLYKLDGGLDHILVDEAQDTSPEQWEVIDALAQEFFAGAGTRADGPARTIFAVGDEKQSIFSFQGADPAFFGKMQEHFSRRVKEAGNIWRDVELKLSFRAAPVILKGVDSVFANEATRVGVSTPGREIRHLHKRIGQAGLVELWPLETPAEQEEPNPWDAPLDQSSPDSPSGRLAKKIAARIAGWLEKKEILESRGRPIRPGDILILVQRRGPFVEEMVRALKSRGVPVAGTDRMVLGEQIAVMDLMALGEFLLMPDDDLTLAVVLKSPFFNFDDDDLFALAWNRGQSLWSALKKRRDENTKFKTACDELEQLLAQTDYLSPFAFYTAFLGSASGRRRLVARLGEDVNDPIDEFISLALSYERTHIPSLQGFLHWFSSGRTSIKRDLEQGRNEVRVMTVHGAKGLESNIVFLPDTCRKPSPRASSGPRAGSGVLWLGADAEKMPFWPAGKKNEESHCAAGRVIEARLSGEEYRRLLYVALTRAQDRLYVAGWETRHPRAADCWYNLVADALKPMGREVTLDSGEIVHRLDSRQEAPVEKAMEQKAAGPRAGSLPRWIGQAVPAEAVPAVLSPSRLAPDEPFVLSPLSGLSGAGVDQQARRYKRGRLIHRLLQSLPGVEQSAREAACRRYLSHATHSLSPAEQEEIAAATLAVMAEPSFSPLFAPGSLAEVPISGALDESGEKTIFGVVDRLVITDKGVLVVDYKTNRPAPESPDKASENYLRQMALYRAALARIYPGKTISCALLWTDGPRLMPLPAEILDLFAP